MQQDKRCFFLELEYFILSKLEILCYINYHGCLCDICLEDLLEREMNVEMCAPVLQKMTVGSSVTVDIQDPIKLDKKIYTNTFFGRNAGRMVSL
jgi:hypothetical protein